MRNTLYKAVQAALSLVPRADTGTLKAVYDNEDDIPEAYRDLFTKRGEKYELTRVQGIRTQGDVERLETTLKKERDAHGETTAKLEKWRGLGEFDDVEAKLDKYPELETKAADAGDIDEKVETIVQSRLSAMQKPLERERDKAVERAEKAEGQVTELERDNSRRRVRDALTQVAIKDKVRKTAINDVVTIGEGLFQETEDGKIVTRSGVGVPEGLEPELWMEEARPTHPHWYDGAQGGGAGGGDGGDGGVSGDNPFATGNWNKTQQAQMERDSPEKALRHAKAAGFKDLDSVPAGKPEEKSA